MESTKERIYIGGLNPPRLSARDIFRRLKSLDQIEIEDNGNDSSDEDDDNDNNNPYLHITAVSKHESDSALSIVSKQYHNVKWKGCKLVVEKAKPHFLERLDEERRQLQLLAKAKELATATATDDAIETNNNNTAETISDAADNAPTPSEALAASRIPRRLRVRKKYGEEAFHVDTKPWTVESWSRFHKARSKLQKQEENHLTKTKTAANASKKKYSRDEQPISAPGPLLHRAVHIRFLAEEKETTNTGRIGSDTRNDNDENSSESESTTTPSVSSSSDSDSESSNEGGTRQEEKPERYTRSFGDDSDNDSDNSVLQHENKDNADDENSSQSTTEMLLLNQKHKKGNNADSEKRKDDRTTSYQWSTDEESSDDEEEGENKKSLATRWPSSSNSGKGLGNSVFSCTDEFMAGFEESASNFDKDDGDDDKLEGYDDQTRSGGGDGGVEPDLVGDVTTNLNILSSIFPDMVDAKPIDPACNDGDSSNNANNKDGASSSGNAIKSNNTTAYGIMPRYDPTAESSRQYVVQEEEESINRDDDENNSRNASSSKQDDAGDDDIMDEEKISGAPDKKRKNESDTKASPAAPDIYEQDELENVFRDARDAWGAEDTRTHTVAAPASSSAATIPNPNNSSGKSGAFSFGFNLDDHDDISKKQNNASAENSTAKDSFNFSFSIPDQNQADSNTTSKQDKAINTNIQTMKQKGDKSMDASEPFLDERDSKIGDVDDDVDVIVTEENVAIRHKGLTLPERDLQTYVDNFFACNDGARIMQDPEGFRNDDRDKAAWGRERQTLTMDWKRKRKYAVTRIQKRMKARRR